MAGETSIANGSRVLVRYRNRDIRQEDVEFIRSTIADGSSNRTRLSERICESWGWRQANGRPAVYACRDLLLRLEEWGYIKLPPLRKRLNTKPRRSWPLLTNDLIPLAWSPVCDIHADLDSLVVRPIKPEERLGWRLFMDRYHYLGCRPLVGEHILYAAFLKSAGNELVALIGWASAAFRSPLREQYIGWDEQGKRKRLHFVINNVRFLVPRWVRVKNLASKVLACNLRRLSSDWQRAWKHPVFLAETFVDRRFRGTCYKAANWQYLGLTAGRSKRGNAYLHNSSPKALYVYPLHKHARRFLRQGRLT